MLRILIADDHEIIRRGLLQILLEEYPFSYIAVAINGKELVDKALHEEWNIVLSDISMPVMNGLEALKQIKQQKPELPVLILSIPSEEQYTVRVLRDGASGYLSKDAAPEELVSAVRQILLGRQYFPSDLVKREFEQVAWQNNPPPHEHLSPREFEVFKMLAQGITLSNIAQSLSLDSSTVGTYRTRILEKMNMKTNADIIQYALQHKLL